MEALSIPISMIKAFSAIALSSFGHYGANDVSDARTVQQGFLPTATENGTIKAVQSGMPVGI